MAKILLRQVSEYVALYRDSRTGIAWVEDGSTGNGHSAHANIDATGSVRGMKKLGYWRKNDRTVRSHGFIYNIDSVVVSDEYDQLAADNCECGGKHLRSADDGSGYTLKISVVKIDSSGKEIESIGENYSVVLDATTPDYRRLWPLVDTIAHDATRKIQGRN